MRPEVEEGKCGFVEGRGTADTLCLLRVVIEHLLEVNRCLRLCYICCTGGIWWSGTYRHGEMFADIQIDVGGGGEVALDSWKTLVGSSILPWIWMVK